MKRENLAQWYRQMAVLTRCGIPATRALEACANQTSDRRLRAATSILLAELRVGQRLSQERLRELLDRDGNRLLTDLMNEQALQNGIELETMFQATVTLCRELGQMVR